MEPQAPASKESGRQNAGETKDVGSRHVQIDEHEIKRYRNSRDCHNPSRQASANNPPERYLATRRKRPGGSFQEPGTSEQVDCKS